MFGFELGLCLYLGFDYVFGFSPGKDSVSGEASGALSDMPPKVRQFS
mgnify:CR=1 FL=1